MKSVQTVSANRLLLTGKAAKHIAGAGHPGSDSPVVLSDVPGEGMYYAAVLEAKVEKGARSPRMETGFSVRARPAVRSCSPRPLVTVDSTKSPIRRRTK